MVRQLRFCLCLLLLPGLFLTLPRSLSARNVSLQWNRSLVDAEHIVPLGYKICESYTAGGQCESEYDAGDNDTYTVIGLALDQDYYFRAKAWALCDGAYCESIWSNEVLSLAEQILPEPATNLQLVASQQQEEPPMAIARTGYSTTAINPGAANSGSFDITVPVGTTCLNLYVTGYNATANIFTGTGATVTLEGASPSSVIVDADTNGSYYAGAGWAFLNPTTGANVTVAYDFVGTGTFPEYPPMFIWVAYSGVGSIRSNYGEQETAPQYETTSLTSSSGDVISVVVFGYKANDAEAAVTSWSNATEIAEFAQYLVSTSDMTLAEHASTGNVTIATTATSNYDDGGIMAFIMIPAAGGGQSVSGSMGRFAGNLTKKLRAKRRVQGFFNKWHIRNGIYRPIDVGLVFGR